MLHVHEKKPLAAQRDLLEEYDDDIGHFIDIENGVHEDNANLNDDRAFAVDVQEEELELELEMEDTSDVPF